ncbi:MAG: ATP-binding protein [Actinomycetota bacterium]|nr:ATP-binding protein [Actinomycetota bacterium]
MATVEIRFSPLPAHVRTARLIASAVARRTGVDEAVLDEVRLAVGEACARAVSLHQEHDSDRPVELLLSDDHSRFTVVVLDAGPAGAEVAESDGDQMARAADLVDAGRLGAPAEDGAASGPLPDLLPAGFGLAVIAGLVEDLEVSGGAGDTGTRVEMSWPLAHGLRSYDTSEAVGG